jgi:hypothetical protein
MWENWVSGNRLNKVAGFTVVELTISITIIAILIVAFSSVITNYYKLIAKTNAQIDMTISSQNLLRATVESLRYGDGVRQSNQIADANAPVGGWSTSNSSFVIIIAVPANNTQRSYIIDSNTGDPYMNELVYYKSGTTLYKRVLANPGATGNTLTTTCPPASATPSCPADKTLAEYVNNMTFNLYDQDGASTADPAEARSVKINLSMSRSIFSDNLTLDNTIRVTMRNRF